MALIAPTGFGKTQSMLTIANALFPLMDRTHVFSSTIDDDPSYEKFKNVLQTTWTLARLIGKTTPGYTPSTPR